MLRCAALLLLVGAARAWITTTQARYGASVEHIFNESLGRNVGEARRSLGYLWSQPAEAGQATGLGSSITWVWDEEKLCKELLPRVKENFWFIPLVSCESLRASMHRAFDTWAMNSRYIKFTDVTQQCEAAGYAPAACPYAEVVVSTFQSLSNETVPEGEPSVSAQHIDFGTTFRSTSGQRPYREFGTDDTAIFRVHREVGEAKGGEISFHTRERCWYTDSQFCSAFHDWKRAWKSQEAAYAVFASLLFLTWTTAVLLMTVSFARPFKSATLMNMKLLAADRAPEDEEGLPAATVLKGILAGLAEFSLTGLTLRLLLIMIVWPFHEAASSCWACYDFEAAAAHEVGHLLGLSHPDRVPSETLPGFAPEGRNSYHAGLAAGLPLDPGTCLNPWANVHAGLPPGAHSYEDAAVGYRKSIMEFFTQHNPRSCLEADDLEALNVLYPDCSGGPTTPVCRKAALNLGWLRVLLFMIMPLLVALMFAKLVLHVARRCKATVRQPEPIAQ
jgi:hypothetical protein